MLPAVTYQRLLNEDEVLGLRLNYGGGVRTFYLRVETRELPNNLADYSLGQASARDTAGTGWNSIVDASGRYYLEPVDEGVIYHVFFGVAPSQAWVYRRFPPDVDINSLIGTRGIGDPVGFIDGLTSPYRAPSPLTEMFTARGFRPEFLGYHPYPEPPSITVRLYFYIARYQVEVVGIDPTGNQEQDSRLVIAPESVRAAAHVRTVGGRRPPAAPLWLQGEVER